MDVMEYIHDEYDLILAMENVCYQVCIAQSDFGWWFSLNSETSFVGTPKKTVVAFFAKRTPRLVLAKNGLWLLK